MSVNNITQNCERSKKNVKERCPSRIRSVVNEAPTPPPPLHMSRDVSARQVFGSMSTDLTAGQNTLPGSMLGQVTLSAATLTKLGTTDSR